MTQELELATENWGTEKAKPSRALSRTVQDQESQRNLGPDVSTSRRLIIAAFKTPCLFPLMPSPPSSRTSQWWALTGPVGKGSCKPHCPAEQGGAQDGKAATDNEHSVLNIVTDVPSPGFNYKCKEVPIKASITTSFIIMSKDSRINKTY